jgi:hypothetical protein
MQGEYGTVCPKEEYIIQQGFEAVNRITMIVIKMWPCYLSRVCPRLFSDGAIHTTIKTIRIDPPIHHKT